jgi:hypothetical protein
MDETSAVEEVNMDPEDRILNAMKAGQRRPCLLCGRRAHRAGVFMPHPEKQHLVNAPPGKIRVIVYALCKSCGRRRVIAVEAVPAAGPRQWPALFPGWRPS